MDASRSRWFSLRTLAKGVTATLIAGAGLTVVAVPGAFAATPTVTAVSPTSGNAAGGTTVTVTGSGFGTSTAPNVTAIHFGTQAATSFHVVKGTQLTVVSPAFNGLPTAPTVDIVVTDGANPSTITAADHFTYTFSAPTVTGVTTVATPPGGPTAGGTEVNIAGNNLSGVTAVHFGANAGTNILENSLESLSVTAPAGSAGTVDITVTNGGGTSTTSAADQFTYNSTLAMANGTGSYATGSSTSTGTTAQPPNDVFNVLDLMTGGPAVNPSSLTVVNQPASGNITFSTNFLVYTPAQTDGGSSGAWTYDVTTTGTQTGTISICETASSSTCITATMTFVQTETGYYMGGVVSALGLTVGVTQDTGNGVSLSSTSGPPGSTFTVTSAPAQALIPATDSGLTVTNVGQYSAMQPIPAGLSLVPGSLKVMGGDQNVTDKYTVSYCTASMGFIPGECTAQMTGNYKTTYPYIETFLNPSASVPGGSALVLPTISAEFTVDSTDTTGQVVNDVETEFVASTSITNGTTSATPTLDAYPSINTCTGIAIGCVPPYQAPSPRWSFTVTAPSNPPTVSSISPTSGPGGGGNTVTINGSNLTGATAVQFGSTGATNVTVVSAAQVTATAPAGTGTVDVTVTTPGGVSTTSPADQYTYIPAPTVTGVSPNSGPPAGGTGVTITGTNFTGATAVDFGLNGAINVTVVSANSITATSPAGTGTVDVTVTTPGGVSTTSTADQFTYATTTAPTVTGVSPNSGPPAGGTAVTITGTNFTGATAVDFGPNPATNVTVVSANSITATSPAGTGTVDVTVTTPVSTSTTSTADHFTYVAPGFQIVPTTLPNATIGVPYGPIVLQTSGAATGAKIKWKAPVKPPKRIKFKGGVLAGTAISKVPPGTYTFTVTATEKYLTFATVGSRTVKTKHIVTVSANFTITVVG